MVLVQIMTIMRENYVLYKFFFYRGYISEAENVVLNALSIASDKGDFEADWNQLTPESADWSIDDGPARVYLYSLKALAFIKLRKGQNDEAEKILDKLGELDPEDRVGSSVIRSLAEGL